MALPQAKGFAEKMRTMRTDLRTKLDALEAQATLAFGGVHDAIAVIQDEVNQVNAIAAEIRGDAAVSGNGGPTLADGTEPSADSSAPPAAETDTRAANFSELHPSARKQTF